VKHLRRRRRRRAARRSAAATIVVLAIGAYVWHWALREESALSDTPRNAAAPDVAAAPPADTSVVPLAVLVDRPPVPSKNKAAAKTAPTTPADEVLTPHDGGRQAPGAIVSAVPTTPREPVTLIAMAPATNPVAAGESGASSTSPNRNLEEILKEYRAGKRIRARTELNRLLAATTDEKVQRELREHLQRIAAETIFSPGFVENDPLIERYAVQPGDVLIQIGRRFSVPHEIIMRLNGIRDPRRIRPGQILKIPRGPFHVVIDKSDFRLDLYLQDLYVRSFRVGLGSDYSTPEGLWVVKERLRNPTYYPPPGSPIKRIVPPDDPENPLGERWIGLRGVEGDAVGREGYGIHGTIEPESIGRNASLGCVRLLNEDVEFLFDTLLPGASRVTIRP